MSFALLSYCLRKSTQAVGGRDIVLFQMDPSTLSQFTKEIPREGFIGQIEPRVKSYKLQSTPP